MFLQKRVERDEHQAGDCGRSQHRPVVSNAVAGEWLKLAGFTPQESQHLLYLRWLYQRSHLSEFPAER